MANQRCHDENAREQGLREAQPKQWIAPVQTVSTFSMAEFTRIDSNPGDDGLGVFTQS